MKHLILCFLALACMPIKAYQSDFVFPWVTNNNSFQATIIINNFGTQTAEITLVATRNEASEGTLTETVAITLNPLNQMVVAASELFPLMGAGAGYSVLLSSPADHLNGALVVNATGTASGASPSQADVVPLQDASTFLTFNFLPLDSGFSAPVIYNPGDLPATVTYHAFQNGQDLETVTRTIGPGQPFADVTTNLFPNLGGKLYVVAESDQPIIGLAFLFNDFQEPSMATAAPLTFLPKAAQTQPSVFFANQIQPIFDANCSSGNCHIGATAGGLNLDPGAAYGNIVNVPALQNSSTSLITPNDPDSSYLFQKLLENGNFFNMRMPNNRPPLSDEEIELIRTWILEGALNN